jgi:GAF domain-containing protein
MFLQCHAITNIAWNDATHKLYKENVEQGLRFYNLNTLFGTVMTSGKPVISNNPRTDPRASGIPKGHPPLNHFLGIPFFKSNGEMNGMVGLSNRPGGYSEEDIAFLEPVTVICANLIHIYLQMEQNHYLINTLEKSVKARTSELEKANADLEEANRRIRRAANRQLEHFASMSHEIRTPLNCIIGKSLVVVLQWTQNLH